MISTAKIIAELPKLTPAQIAELQARLSEIAESFKPANDSPTPMLVALRSDCGNRTDAVAFVQSRSNTGD